MPQCKGKTVQGIRCKRNVKVGIEYCYIHAKPLTISPITETASDEYTDLSKILESESISSSTDDDQEINLLDELKESRMISDSDDDVIRIKKRACHICRDFEVPNLCIIDRCVNFFGPRVGIVDVIGDGYCFWRAMSYCVFYSQEHYKSFLYKCMHSKKQEETISTVFVEFWEIPIIAKYCKRQINVYLVQKGKLCKYICNHNGVTDSYTVSKREHIKMGEVNIVYTPGHYKALVT